LFNREKQEALMRRILLTATLLLIGWANAMLLADAPRDVDWLTVEIDYLYEQGSDTPVYGFGAAVGTETTSIVGGTLTTPGGAVLDLTYDPDEPEWGSGAEHLTAADLSAYGDGVYTFTLDYGDGSSAVTALNFVIPGSEDPIGQPTHKPLLTKPVPGTTGVTNVLTFSWESPVDQNINLIQLLVSYEGYSPNDEVLNAVLWDATQTSYGPVTLSAGVMYDDCHMDFAEHYFYVNADGIPCNFSKAAIAEFTFGTVPEPATLALLALGGLVLLRRRRASL